jgi:hypothetical protein
VPGHAYETGPMKRKIAWTVASVSGLYLLTLGPLPDPVPLMDEAVALAVFLTCASHLGYNFAKWLPFARKRGKGRRSQEHGFGPGLTLDV